MSILALGRKQRRKIPNQRVERKQKKKIPNQKRGRKQKRKENSRSNIGRKEMYRKVFGPDNI